MTILRYFARPKLLTVLHKKNSKHNFRLKVYNYEIKSEKTQLKNFFEYTNIENRLKQIHFFDHQDFLN